MKNIEKRRRKSNAHRRVEETMNLINGSHTLGSRMLLIQQLIPIGLMAVEEALQAEVETLAGVRYRRDDNPNRRWGSNVGSVLLGRRKHSIRVPRVRHRMSGVEVPLTSYRALQSDREINDQTLAQAINGISARKFKKAVLQIPSAFGIQKSSVSENKQVCRDFLNQLKERGLQSEESILFVIDASKGIRKGIQAVFGEQAVIQRCQWHKRENVVAYLPKSEQARFRRKLQKAYEQTSYGQAKQKLSAIRKELQLINASAVSSLDEGLEETLTLHRLGLFEQLGISLKTTNCIESLNSQLGQYTRRVTYWKNSNQRQRWVAMALLEIEPSLRKIKGYRFLPLLKSNMEKYTQDKNQSKAA